MKASSAERTHLTLRAIGDVTLVEQALSNAVHNAIRYHRDGGHVAVVLETDGPTGFRLRVLDDGPGLTAAEITRLTQRRARGDDAHGWEMSLDRSEYGGLEVSFVGERTC